MTRREFPKQVKRDAALRANGRCECCGIRLRSGQYHYDHIIPDALDGEPTLENCAVLCTKCHAAKTTKQDVPAISKAKRNWDKDHGIRTHKPAWNTGPTRQPTPVKYLDRADALDTQTHEAQP